MERTIRMTDTGHGGTTRLVDGRAVDTRAEFIAKIAKLYDVPMTLIRYEEITYTVPSEGM